MNVTSKERYHMISGSSAIQPRAEFMNVIANEPSLKSKDGFVVMDLDGVIRNYKSGNMMFLEIKNFLCVPGYAQNETIKAIAAMIKDPHFKGVFLLQHENSGPYDGYNKLSVYDKTQQTWKNVTSASVDRLTGDNVFAFIHNILS